MIGGVALQKTPDGWSFTSEAALEKFIWMNLKELFSVEPLKQQYLCNLHSAG